eukprot:3828427-Pyramimonas_sp.AAC.1
MCIRDSTSLASGGLIEWSVHGVLREALAPGPSATARRSVQINAQTRQLSTPLKLCAVWPAIFCQLTPFHAVRLPRVQKFVGGWPGCARSL